MAVNINIPSQVSQTITDGVTDKAPSEDAVHDALALKANSADLGATAFSNDYNDLDNLPTIPVVTGFVPYTGATQDVDLGTYNLTADHISLNVSPSGAGFNVGSTQWNNTSGSSETLLKGGNVTLKNGVDLVARVVNKVVPNTTLTKAAYQAVKVSGAQGQRLAVNLAQANNDNNSADTLGIVTETIATNQEGFIMTVGQLEGINTTGSLQGETWADGDVLYLSPTVAGGLTNIKPTGATGHIVVMGYVEYAHANNGKIYVKIMNGWELDELHNVYINPSTLADNNLLQYDSATQLWKNESLSTAGIQPTLVSGTNIKTVNSNSLLGSGNVAVQDVLVSGTNIKTINGNSILGSGNITVGGGITIGTTAITSGTVGRILFEGTGNVVQQSASLFWDNTNSRLGIGTSTPSSVLNATAANSDFRFSTGLSNLTPTLAVINTDPASKAGAILAGTLGAGFAFDQSGQFSIISEAKSAFTGNSLGGGTLRMVLNGTTGNVGIGTGSTLGARLDVRAQGALSTDIAFRVRNSADSADLFQHRGDGYWAFRNNAGNKYIYWDGSSQLELGTVGAQTLSLSADNIGVSKVQTTSDIMWLGSTTHTFISYKNGNFQLEETSGILQTSGKGGLSFKNAATIPSANTADRFIMYSTDIVAGNAAPHFRTENGNIIKLFRGAALTASDGTLANAVTRIAELEARLQAHGLIA